jgi:hypothetical protein
VDLVVVGPRLAPSLLAAAAVLLAGCTSRPARVAARAAAAPPAPVRAQVPDPYYDVPGPVPTAKVERKEERRSHRVWKVEIPFRAPGGASAAARKPVRLTWYEPRVGGAGRRPLVMISPILGSDTDFVEGFAESFASRGWHAAIVRRPKLEYDPDRPLTQVEDGMRVAVMRHRQALEWFLARDDVDPARLATFGISAGGILGSVVAATDPRYAAHVVCLAGGPLCDVLCDTTEDGLEEIVEEAEKTERLSREELREELRRVVRTDPVGLAHRADPSKMLLFLARFDETVPTRCGRRLWRALGKPEMVMVPLGHYTSVLLLPWVRGRAVDFLTGRFEAVPAAR